MYEAVLAQAAMLRDMGALPVMLGIGDTVPATGAETHLLRSARPAALGYAPGMARALDDARLDLLHLHGIWQYPSLAGSRWAARIGRPYLISPHGMLDPWITARGRWKKRLARTAWERRGWRRASTFHALTDAEARNIRAESGEVRIVTISNPAPSAALAPAGERPPMLLYLGRIHPKKNLAALIAGWTAAHPQLPSGARLVVAGWGASTDVAAFRDTIADVPACRFIGPVDGLEKAALLPQARFLALPSLSEGLPMAVLEAWAHATPTLMSRACHLPEGFESGAAINCGDDPATVAQAIRKGFALSSADWLLMSDAAQRLAQTRFSRVAVTRAWERTYAELLGLPA